MVLLVTCISALLTQMGFNDSLANAGCFETVKRLSLVNVIIIVISLL